MYIVFVTSRIDDNAFQINRLLQTEVKRRKIQAKKEKNAKFMALQCQIESSQQRQRDCRIFQLVKEFVHGWRLEKRAIIYNLFFNFNLLL